MMKKHLFFAAVALVGLTACTSEEEIFDSEKEAANENPDLSALCFTVQDTARTVKSEARAMEIAGRFLSGTEGKSRANTDAEVSTVYQGNGNPAMYVVNYANDGGFVIVSATKDTEPILAYSETGSFSLDSIEGSPAGMWLSDSKLYVEHSSTLPDSIKQRAAQQWERLTNTTVPVSKLQSRAWGDPEEAAAVYQALEYYRSQGYEIYENPQASVHVYSYNLNQALNNLSDQKDGDGYSQREKSFLLIKTTYRQENVSPKTTTTWAQGYPYNCKLTQKHPKAQALGCVTVAVAQLMKYYAKPNGGFQYDKMPDQLTAFSSGEGYEVLTDFLLTVGEKLNIDYANGNSNSSYKTGTNLLKSYGFSNAKYVDYADFFSVRDQIQRGPIGLRAEDKNGDGHVWVCDGYDHNTWQTEYTLISYNGDYMDATPTCFHTVYTEWNGNGYHSMHMNWGWGGTNNGYFSETWEIMDGTEKVNYSKDRKAIINLN